MAKEAETTPIQDADKILASIKDWTLKGAALGKKINAEIDAIQEKHGNELRKIDATITALGKTLEKLVNKYEADIMEGQDRVDLSAGSILVKREKRVKRIKGMLEKLKKARLESAIKTPKEVVDWDVVEKFNDDRLASLGTERVEKTIITYDLIKDEK